MCQKTCFWSLLFCSSQVFIYMVWNSIASPVKQSLFLWTLSTFPFPFAHWWHEMLVRKMEGEWDITDLRLYCCPKGHFSFDPRAHSCPLPLCWTKPLSWFTFLPALSIVLEGLSFLVGQIWALAVLLLRALGYLTRNHIEKYWCCKIQFWKDDTYYKYHDDAVDIEICQTKTWLAVWILLFVLILMMETNQGSHW